MDQSIRSAVPGAAQASPPGRLAVLDALRGFAALGGRPRGGLLSRGLLRHRGGFLRRRGLWVASALLCRRLLLFHHQYPPRDVSCWKSELACDSATELAIEVVSVDD